MKPWNIIGWFVVAILVLALLGTMGYAIFRGICLLIEYLPAGINWWVEQPAWLKWWIIPSFFFVGATGCHRVLCSTIEDTNEMIKG